MQGLEGTVVSDELSLFQTDLVINALQVLEAKVGLIYTFPQH
jgi:hypothetical protein